MLVRHEVDRPAWARSASSESGSLELLMTLHALVGATICGSSAAIDGAKAIYNYIVRDLSPATPIVDLTSSQTGEAFSADHVAIVFRNADVDESGAIDLNELRLRRRMEPTR